MGRRNHCQEAVTVSSIPIWERFPRTTVSIAGKGHFEVDKTVNTVLVAAGKHGHGGCGCSNDDDDNGEGDVVEIDLPENPLPGQWVKIVAQGANALVKGGCCGEICGIDGGFVVAQCSSNTFTWASNKVEDCCGCCGCSGKCGCPDGSWVPEQPSPVSGVVVSVEDLEDLTEFDITDAELVNGALAAVASLGGAIYVLSLAGPGSVAVVNGTTVVATSTGVGRWLRTPSTPAMWYQLVTQGTLVPLVP